MKNWQGTAKNNQNSNAHDRPLLVELSVLTPNLDISITFLTSYTDNLIDLTSYKSPIIPLLLHYVKVKPTPTLITHLLSL
jgi:hypothetical protein